MTRTEALAIITAKLASLDDEQVTAVVEIVQSMPAAGQRLRPLSARETALLEQSKADFREGRTLTLDELDAFLDAAATARSYARTP